MKLSFQFHKGTIKTCVKQLGFIEKSYFNSIKVQLRLTLGFALDLYSTNFNSIKVQLRLYDDNVNVQRKQYFNSIKVQLRPFLLYYRM